MKKDIHVYILFTIRKELNPAGHAFDWLYLFVLFSMVCCLVLSFHITEPPQQIHNVVCPLGLYDEVTCIPRILSSCVSLYLYVFESVEVQDRKYDSALQF